VKRRIVIMTVVQVIGLLYFNVLQANTAAIETSSIQGNQPISESELTRRFNTILDNELSGENVCVTVSGARRLNALMTTSAQKIISERAFNRVGEAETNIKKFAKTLLKNATQSGRTRITPETIENTIGMTEPPESSGGPGEIRDLFCPLFPIC
jgi:hypothetical protein